MEEAKVVTTFELVQQMPDILNSHGTIFIARRPGPRIVTTDFIEEMSQFYVFKEPNNNEDVEQLEKEYTIFNEIGEDNHIIRKIEYHNNGGICYLALEYAKARSLFNYLIRQPNIVHKNEGWSRFYFRQYIAGL